MSLTEDKGFDPSTRRLCPDGTCTGILDDGGWCTECRKTWRDAEIVRAADAEASDEEELAADAEPEASANSFLAGRRLCDNGACTGVVAPDGRCSVCGSTAQTGDA